MNLCLKFLFLVIKTLILMQSGLLMDTLYLKRQLGVDAEAVALGTPNEETAFVLDYFGVERTTSG